MDELSQDDKVEDPDRLPRSGKDTPALLSIKPDHSEASKAVIAVVAAGRDGRCDGALRAPGSGSGVAVSAVTRHGPMTRATDRYESRYHSSGPSWRANLHAIALTLESLRAVDRYGTTSTGEQYVGWRALEAKAASNVTVDAAEALVREYSGGPAAQSLTWHVRRAQAQCHPDRTGDRARWDRLEVAIGVLRAAGVVT